ncbi:hypothetical protein PM082_015562 [Marasmius tenuissimus]|nr:hypothetical protein PM082_015562 [Marasmius tenuissimus]
MTSQFEQLFSSTKLDVVVPNTSLEFPPSKHSADEWLETLQSGAPQDRKEAFFDEHIQAVLTARIPHPEQAEKPTQHDPPPVLLSFLSHLQISLEASYISPTPDIPEHANTATPRSDTPPRSVSLKGKKPMALNLSPNPPTKASSPNHHPSILPPATPIPTPASTENDRRYAQSEGIMLCTRIWGGEGPTTLGDDDDEDEEGAEESRPKKPEAKPKEAFHLVWSEKEKVWVAVYKVVFTVAFLRLPFRLPPGASPLLCITLSTTLRELPVAVNGPKNPLARYISSLEGTRLSVPTHSPTSPNSPTSPSRQDSLSLKGGLAEVNLLGGLYPVSSDPNSPTSPTAPTRPENPAEGDLVLPSTRLGPSMRSSLFHLSSSPGGPPPSPQLTPMQTPGGALKPAAHPTLRKSFRKTLFATSGFKVRMRTVFVPSLLMDEDDEEEEEREDDALSSGPEEGTVVLCVEVENEQDPFASASDFGGRNAGGILVERVEVGIGGGEDEGARAELIGWDADALLAMKRRRKEKVPSKFPLLLTPREQFNLLYAVTFLRNPEEVDIMSTVSLDGRSAGLKPGGTIMQTGPGKDMVQRSVTLKIFGRPSYVYRTSAETSFYPTSTFCTRWNCILDLSTTSLLDRRIEDDMGPTSLANPNHPFAASAPSVLPEPASPFPASITSPRLPPSNPGSLLAGDMKRASLASYSRSGTSSRSSTPANANPNIDNNRRHTIATGATSGATSLIKAATAGARNSFTPVAMSPPPPPERRDSYGFGFPSPRERRDSGGPRGGGSPLAYTPPSSMLQSQMPRSPTTYEAPPPLPFKDRNGALSVAIPGPTSPGPSLDQVMGQMPPLTPAYPAYPPPNNNTSPSHTPLPPTPPSQGPFIPQGGSNVPPGQGSYLGPSVDIRREKGMMMPGGGHSPQTPAPHVGFGVGGAAPGMFEGAVGGVSMNGLGGGVDNPIVVSIGLKTSLEAKGKDPGARAGMGTGKIYPSERFTLDIFVFNKSSWTRRFDISCPDPRVVRKRNQEKNFGKALDLKGRAKALPGVVPLENRVRIGPLLPSACQSVGMEFIALAPGVHSIDTLTLTDTETGFAMNLRSVMDIVVHEKNEIS